MRVHAQKRINILKDYGIRNGALFRLVRRKEHPGPGKGVRV